ncbi:MAG TPA: GTPase [Bryobacteraceae bacterium]|nr:GTPase [Bryobacteraceae bacterium]
MPANLGPEYLAAEAEYRSAHTAPEKIAALEKMFATLPKHKGTEKMQADIRRRLSQARKESQKKGASHAVPFYLVPREGAGQVVLLGPANSGKSSLVGVLTHAHPEVGDFPFTTRLPTSGMMHFENVPIQLIDLPPISAEFTEPWLPQTVRHADASVLVVDVNDAEDLDEIELIEADLRDWHLPPPRLLACNKVDQAGAAGNFAALADLFRERYRAIPVSAASGQGLAGFARAVFDLLDVVRAYTKAPGKKAELDKPYVLRRGATVLDAARQVHKDFAEHLRFARLYRRDGGHDGMMVERQHVIQDEDILEFHL